MKNVIIKKIAIAAMLILAALSINSCKKKITDEQIARYGEIRKEYAQGHYEKAAGMAKDLARKNRGFYQGRLLYGKSLYMNSDYLESGKVLEKLCKDYEFYPEAEKWYIRSLLQSGKTEEAVAEVKKALSFDPENIDFLSLAASAYAGTDNLQAQLDFLNQIPLQTDKIARAHLELAKIYHKYLDYQQALYEIDQCLLYLGDNNILRKPVEDLKKRILENQESAQ